MEVLEGVQKSSSKEVIFGPSAQGRIRVYQVAGGKNRKKEGASGKMRNSVSIKCAVQRPEAEGAWLLQGSDHGMCVAWRGWLRWDGVGRLGGKRGVRHTSRRLLGVQKEMGKVGSLDMPPCGWGMSASHVSGVAGGARGYPPRALILVLGP